MKISRFISGSVTEVVQGLLQAQKATVILAVGSANTQGYQASHWWRSFKTANTFFGLALIWIDWLTFIVIIISRLIV